MSCGIRKKWIPWPFILLLINKNTFFFLGMEETNALNKEADRVYPPSFT